MRITLCVCVYSDFTGVGTEILAYTIDDLNLSDLNSVCSQYRTEENAQWNLNCFTDKGLEQTDLRAESLRTAIKISLF